MPIGAHVRLMMTFWRNRVPPYRTRRTCGLDPNTVTLLDLREPADFAAHPVPGAINAPFDPLAHVLKTVPKDRTVVVYCAEGWWSEEVAEILADRGYDVASLTGGFRAYQEYRQTHLQQTEAHPQMLR